MTLPCVSRSVIGGRNHRLSMAQVKRLQPWEDLLRHERGYFGTGLQAVVVASSPVETLDQPTRHLGGRLPRVPEFFTKGAGRRGMRRLSSLPRASPRRGAHHWAHPLPEGPTIHPPPGHVTCRPAA